LGNVAGEEIAQEVCITARENPPKFRQEAALSTWLFGLAKHKCTQILQNLARRRAILVLALKWPMPMADVHAVLGSGEGSLHSMPLDDARSPGAAKGGMKQQSRAGPSQQMQNLRNIHPNENLSGPFRDILI
jgi:DNA-directed RNA polymerase specialized sigma24 family protein